MNESRSNSTPGQDRDRFMRPVRAALGRGGTQPPVDPAPAVAETVVRLASPSDDLVELFTRGAEAVGMVVRRVAADTLVEQTVSLMAELNAKRAVTAVTTLPDGVDLDESLRAAGIEVVDWRAPGGVDAMYDVDVGVTDVHAALAETGTLVCSGDADHARALSLVPPVHVAIVRVDDILPDMIDYWARVSADGRVPSSTAFITGPSKTADIEGKLVEGVHGPEKVIILIVEG